MYNKVLIYNEPLLLGGHCTIELTEQEAINIAKGAHAYEDDALALEDFITIHWAWYKHT